MCDGMTCDSSTLFIYPTNLTDSFGVCQCDQSDTYQPFDCGEKPKSYKWIYYALGLIFFILMILLAVIVPVVCFMQRRRQMRSDFEKL